MKFYAMSSSHAKSVAGMAVLLWSLLFPGRPAAAQPPVQRVGETIADRPSEHYRFEQFPVSSPDGQRHWRVYLAIPKSCSPEAGFPSFWMLDGNAALMDLDSTLLEQLGSQPVALTLVFIAHESEFRIASAATYRDYTPTLLSPEMADAIESVTGGADAMLEIIERTMAPEVNRRVKLDPNDRTLWGHSLGGVFVLHTLFTRTGAFQNYVAASPSMWWGGGVLARQAKRFVLHHAGPPATVAVHVGGHEYSSESRSQRDASNPRVSAMLKLRRSVPPDSAKRLVDDFDGIANLQITYREFPKLGHGDMFGASLTAALREKANMEETIDIPASGLAAP